MLIWSVCPFSLFALGYSIGLGILSIGNVFYLSAKNAFDVLTYFILWTNFLDVFKKYFLNFGLQFKMQNKSWLLSNYHLCIQRSAARLHASILLVSYCDDMHQKIFLKLRQWDRSPTRAQNAHEAWAR